VGSSDVIEKTREWVTFNTNVKQGQLCCYVLDFPTASV
jgi:hypothetical protein